MGNGGETQIGTEEGEKGGKGYPEGSKARGAEAQPKGEVRAKAQKVKKKVLRKVYAVRHRKVHTFPTFCRPHMLWLQLQPKYPGKSTPTHNKMGHYAIIKFLLTTELAVKKKPYNMRDQDKI
ncbi:large ribosomal subunit protein uL23-like [Lethenteron reissneri]|uniref:large ribosomal subunit protein uL23-like n=1 Tax=Lethenteron reissneri TaxID=7753 RepID=UPI002AB61C96|nr:large ribosomal subunit protein uL23-like [Lethenteron reissneri]